MKKEKKEQDKKFFDIIPPTKSLRVQHHAETTCDSQQPTSDNIYAPKKISVFILRETSLKRKNIL